MPGVRRNVATIAQTIARFEPVSMLVRPEDVKQARRLVGPSVELIEAPLGNLWMRETGVADFVASRASVQALNTDLVPEVGSIEVDGEGTALITDGHTDFCAWFARPGVVAAGFRPGPGVLRP